MGPICRMENIKIIGIIYQIFVTERSNSQLPPLPRLWDTEYRIPRTETEDVKIESKSKHVLPSNTFDIRVACVWLQVLFMSHVFRICKRLKPKHISSHKLHNYHKDNPSSSSRFCLFLFVHTYPLAESIDCGQEGH
jgi:hypothetical protein